MAEKAKIESKLKEAELYKTQGLYEQSKQIYTDLLKLIKEDSSLSQDKQLLDDINKRLQTVDEVITEVEEATDTPELTEDVQDLISNLFLVQSTVEIRFDFDPIFISQLRIIHKCASVSKVQISNLHYCYALMKFLC